MKKRWIILSSTLLVTSLGLAAWAVDAPSGSRTVTNYGKKDAAQFDHGKHADVKCAQCHHNEGEPYKCGECHKLEDGEAPNIKDAFHKKDTGTCYACHLLKEAEHKMKCNDCHKG